MGTYVAAKTCGARSYPIFGVPCGLTSGLGPNEGMKWPLYPVTSLRMQIPKSMDPHLYQGMKSMLGEIRLSEEGVLVLQQGTATCTGRNLSFQGKLVTTFLQPIDGKPPAQDEIFKFSTKKFFPRTYHAHHPILSLTAGWQGAFYHWVFEVLPRLHLAEKAGHSSVPIYVEVGFPFQRESLELLGITLDRVINAKEYAALSAPELIIPSIPTTPTHWACSFLREKILPKIPKKTPFRLYLSRNDARCRRIINEDAVLGILKKYGFEKVELSKRLFKEQVELFQAAEAVIAPHGAGLSHLVFCQPNIPVLEIFSPAYFNPCYWHVCDRVGLSYHYLFGKGDFDTQSHLDPDIEVDLDKFEASCKLMGL